MKEVILVDVNDKILGTMEKILAHQLGRLHRAFSVYLLNSKGEFLLQRRAKNKYHSAGLWTNTCCSHPQINETTTQAATRRLNEEMGITTQIKHVHQFIYKAEFDNGLIEHELDHIYMGIYNDAPNPDANEVMEWRYISKDDLIKELTEQPNNYTEWFKLSYQVVLKNNIADHLLNHPLNT